MLKALMKNRISRNNLCLKCFSSNNKVAIFPDTIVEQLKTMLSKNEVNDSEWIEMEAKITENIHFFDRDQYVDTISLIADANKGTESLWGVLSRKIYDFDLDLAQSFFVNEVLRTSTKHDEMIADPIARNNLVYDIKWPQASKLFVEKLL